MEASIGFQKNFKEIQGSGIAISEVIQKSCEVLKESFTVNSWKFQRCFKQVSGNYILIVL